MNERIQELAEQAMSATFNKFSGVEWSADEWRNFYDTKFAELIVQECMNAVCDPGTTYLESMTESSAMYTARERIRKHFGG